MRFGYLLQKTAAAYPIKWVKTTWKLYAVNDGAFFALERAKIFGRWDSCENKKAEWKTSAGHKVVVKVKTLTQSRSESPQQLARL